MAEAHGGLEKALTSKVDGIPAWSIGAVLAVAILGVVWWRNRQSNGAPDATQDDTTDSSLVGSDTTDDTGDDGSGADLGSGGDVGLPVQGMPAPTTNDQWSRLALDELLAKGDDPTLVSNALEKYLNGDSLSTAEQAIVNLALQLFGAPPEGILPINTGSGAPVSGTGGTTTSGNGGTLSGGTGGSSDGGKTATQPPKTVSSGAKYVTVKRYTTKNPPWESTLSTIAEHEHTTVAKLLKLNPSIKNPNVIYTGQKIRVS